MKKGLTELVFILDRSGSMHGLEKDTIGGFNSMIEKQKKEEGEALVSTVLFDDQVEVICDRKPIQRVESMTEKEYYTRGCTALLDAVGGAISHIARVHKMTKPEYVPEKTIFVITTDGLENASKEYTYQKIKSMIRKEEEKYGWEFIFLGANIDVAKEAEKLGVRSEMAVAYENDSDGVAINYRAVSEAMSFMRTHAAGTLKSSWADEIRENHRKKNR